MTMDKARLADRESFITADGSAIRELAHPAWTAAANQSLAEATVHPGEQTAEHLHPQSEELYYFVAGEGRMRLDGDEAPVAAGDCVVIPPGTPHKLWNSGPAPLVLLCCCAPAYSDADTVMTGR
jgi:mannose-6-phosphate isomerase-like protein (cupin superfamily)